MLQLKNQQRQKVLKKIKIWQIIILAIIDSNKFDYKNKIGVFKYIDIKDLVNKIRNNTISEISAKTSLNTLNELKNAGITKQKKPHP